MKLLSSQIASGTSNTLTISNITSVYDHLMIIFSGRSDYTTSFPSEVGLRFNGDSGANYSYQIQTAINTTIAASSLAGQSSIACCAIPNDNGGATNFPGQAIITIANYKNTTFYKSAMCTQGWTTATTSQGNFRNVGSAWANAAAINSISLVELSGGNFKANSTIWVYGY